MIRPEVEKLKGLVLTPEELNDVILPLVATSKERNKEEKDELPTVNDFCVCVDKLVAKWKEIEKQSKTEKRLWKARILDTPKNKDSICLFQKDYCTDVREMSVKEAVEWYKDLKEHLNDFESVYDSYARGLYYKKDGEWVRFNVYGDDENEED